MRKVNWKKIVKSTKDLKRKVKNLSTVGDYLKDRPGEGLFKDNISKNIVHIDKAKSSSLRRYVKLLDSYYYIVSSASDKEWILSKKIEIETILNGRDDGTIKKTEDL
jgi:hypothetical protein